MKKLAIAFLALLSISSFASCIEDIQNLDFSSDDKDKLTIINNANVELTNEMLDSININLGFKCSLEQISLTSYLAASGAIYHLVLTSDDSCDGGNSYGYAYDNELMQVAVVRDGYTSCFAN